MPLSIIRKTTVILFLLKKLKISLVEFILISESSNLLIYDCIFTKNNISGCLIIHYTLISKNLR